MKLAVKLNYIYGKYLIFFILALIIFSILTGHFGFAKELGNFILILSFFILGLQIFRGKVEVAIDAKKDGINFYLVLGWIVLILLTLIVFRSIFSPGPAVWSDAPYIYPQAGRDFLSEPLVWESRGRFGVVNDLYWIYPIMTLYYGLISVVGLSNDLVIRVLFYFPAIFFALFSPWKFSKFFGFSNLVSFFSSTVYVLSTYFILVVDGGQIGVALAYGLFPFVLLQLHKLNKEASIKQFSVTLASFMLLTASDARFSVIAILAFVFWIILEFILSGKINSLKVFIYFILSVLVLSSYFLIPSIVLEPTTGAGGRSDLQTVSVLNPIFLYSPHWPLNEFGKIFEPEVLFIGIPILIFTNIFFFRKKIVFILTLSFLFFAFLAKGDSGFLGSIYSTLLDKIPFGGAFRDSTKFFTPLTLFAGVLIGLSVEQLNKIINKRVLSNLITLLLFLYIISLVHPAIGGMLKGVLSERPFPEDQKVIAEEISPKKDFFRTIWFPEKHPLGFSSERKPAIDAKMLVNLRPFASINVGSFDRFNFLHNSEFLEWMDIFGVRFLIFSGDTRRFLPDKEKEKDWEDLITLVRGSKGLEKLNLGTNVPVYQTRQSKPRIFTVDKLFAVLGGDDIYAKLENNNENFSVGNQGFVFFEDGKFNPETLEEIDKDDAFIIFNEKQEIDLTLSFLKNFFVSPLSAEFSDWALREHNDYLNWKFELLVNGIETREFDYGVGIAFSSIPGEELKFNLKSKEKNDYILAIRHMSASESSTLNLTFEDLKSDVHNNLKGQFEWYTKEITLGPGAYTLTLKNPQGFQVINAVSLIPKKEFENAKNRASNLISKFTISDNINIPLSNWHEVEYEMESPVSYKVEINPDTSWLVFTDTFHEFWALDQGDKAPFPFYSAVNGFYIEKNNKKNVIIYFKGQKYSKHALTFSVVSLGVIVAILFWVYYRDRRL